MNIIVTGDFGHAEFRDSFANEIAANGDCRFEHIALADLLQRKPNDKHSVDAIVVTQSRRGQFADDQILKLWERFPLTERILIYGSWCEGETRSGQPLSGIRRIHVRQWPALLENWLSINEGQPGSMRGQPVSFTRVDELLTGSVDDTRELPQLRLLVSSRCPDFLETITCFGESRNWRVASCSNEKVDLLSYKPDVLICECYYSIDEAVSLLTEKPALLNLPIVVVLGFPRKQDEQALESLGVEFALLGKPFGNETLLGSIRILLQKRRLNIVSDVA